MSRKEASIILLGSVIGLWSVFYFVDLLYQRSNLISFDTSVTLDEQGREMEKTLPVRLMIPRLEVDASVEFVGLTPLGAMDVPERPLDVAWFNFGPRPGEVGTSVIAGHRGWKNGQSAVFDNLDKLRVGDNLYVETLGGQSLTFVVREIRVYDYDAYAPEVFSSLEGTHLNLVTCIGAWNITQRASEERLVVFTDIVY